MANYLPIDSDAYYRVYKALHLVTHEALPCVDNCLKVWHAQQLQVLSPCTAQCPDGKKPKLPASCPNCIAWGTAIEGALYQPPANPSSTTLQLAWANVNQSNLSKSHVEVAKAFVLRLPKKQGNTGANIQHYRSVSDFDSASLLMIMARFAAFHHGDQASYDTIIKVRIISRNKILSVTDNL